MENKESQNEVGFANVAENGLPAWKRVFDAAVLLVTLPVWLPAGLGVALAIKIGSRGPILFRQERVGYRGNTFVCFKFRTMKPNAATEAHETHVKGLIRSAAPMTKLDSRRDDRLIPFGNWIRAAGLDELPQIINILRGEMSIVGPRPCIPYEFELFEDWQQKRCDAPPGLTGLWQVNGKNRTTFEQMVRYDIEYTQRMSLWLDACIVLRTAPAIVRQLSDLIAAKRARRRAQLVVGPAAAASNSVSSVTSASTQKALL